MKISKRYFASFVWAIARYMANFAVAMAVVVEMFGDTYGTGERIALCCISVLILASAEVVAHLESRE